MATLTVRFKGKMLHRHALPEESAILIGRRATNHIVIDNPGVSNIHARVFFKNDHFYIEDLGSTNGTFVNEKLVNTHRLKDEDVIAIGKHELVFCEYEKYTITRPSASNAPFSLFRKSARDWSTRITWQICRERPSALFTGTSVRRHSSI